MIRATLIALALALPLTAQAECRQALALALDVSGSVDSREYVLQHQGLANALRDPDVATALLAMPATPVELMVYEWSGPGSARVLLPWRAITSPAVLATAAAKIETIQRTGMPPDTALGAAMQYGITALARRSCWQRTLDISGDGKSNTGPLPAGFRAQAIAQNVTINALVIGSDARAVGNARQVEIGELIAYFHANVIAGPSAFTEPVLGFADYEAAMTRKLKRELEGLAISRR